MTPRENDDYVIGLYDGKPIYRRHRWMEPAGTTATPSSITFNNAGGVAFYDYRNSIHYPYVTTPSITAEPVTNIYYGIDWTNWDSPRAKAKSTPKQEEDGEFTISNEMEEFLNSLCTEEESN